VRKRSLATGGTRWHGQRGDLGALDARDSARSVLGVRGGNCAGVLLAFGRRRLGLVAGSVGSLAIGCLGLAILGFPDLLDRRRLALGALRLAMTWVNYPGDPVTQSRNATEGRV
jgi:hypothetical protein